MEGDFDGTNGRTPPILHALRRHADEATAWIEATTDPAALDAIVDTELAVVRRATARLRALYDADDEGPDEWLNIHQLAALIGRSISWIRHQPPDAIPGRRQAHSGAHILWSKRAVLRWLEGLTVRA
jgi:hypothetical protein